MFNYAWNLKDLENVEDNGYKHGSKECQKR